MVDRRSRAGGSLLPVRAVLVASGRYRSAARCARRPNRPWLSDLSYDPTRAARTFFVRHHPYDEPGTPAGHPFHVVEAFQADFVSPKQLVVNRRAFSYGGIHAQGIHPKTGDLPPVQQVVCGRGAESWKVVPPLASVPRKASLSTAFAAHPEFISTKVPFSMLPCRFS